MQTGNSLIQKGQNSAIPWIPGSPVSYGQRLSSTAVSQLKGLLQRIRISDPLAKAPGAFRMNEFHQPVRSLLRRNMQCSHTSQVPSASFYYFSFLFTILRTQLQFLAEISH